MKNIKKENFVKNFLRVVESRLNKDLPQEASEGEFIMRAYDLTSGQLRHVIIEKYSVIKGEKG